MVTAVDALGDQISQDAAHEHVGGKVLSAVNTGKADCGSEAVRNQFGECPWVLVGDPSCDRPCRRGVFRGKRSAAREERAAAVSLIRSEEHTSELQSLRHLVCRLLL